MWHKEAFFSIYSMLYSKVVFHLLLYYYAILLWLKVVAMLYKLP